MRLYCYAAPAEGRELHERLPSDVEAMELGVGKTRAALMLSQRLASGPPPSHIVLFGVAGVLPARLGGTTRLRVGDVCAIESDRFADEGLVSEEGFRDLGEMGLGEVGPWGADASLTKLAMSTLGVRSHPAMTLSTASGTDEAARQAATRGHAQIESMEGAAVAMVAAHFKVGMVHLRAISNFTGARERGGWELEQATSVLARHVLAFAATAP